MPVYNPVSTITKSFDIVIDAYCHYTIFEYDQPATLIHEIGMGAKTYAVPDIKDSVSMTMGSPVDGLTYCRGRTYYHEASYVTKDPTSPAVNASVVVWDLASKTFTFDSSATADYGVY